MRPIRVLIVDDEPLVVQVNRFFVEEVEGFKVIGTARNGSAALEAAERLKPDLILLDVYMPDKDGLEALQELRANGVPADVILVSAAQDPQIVQAALRGGAHDYVIKPFRPERLRAALESYRDVKSTLKSAVRLSQKELDKVWRTPVVVNREEPAKGLNEKTLDQVMTYLREQSTPPTAAEVADGLGMSRVTARRYLEFLVKQGRVKLEMQYGGVGRPLNRYILVKQ
ncbi:MAG: response regulator [Bacillota bacterium]